MDVWVEQDHASCYGVNLAFAGLGVGLFSRGSGVGLAWGMGSGFPDLLDLGGGRLQSGSRAGLKSGFAGFDVGRCPFSTHEGRPEVGIRWLRPGCCPFSTHEGRPEVGIRWLRPGCCPFLTHEGRARNRDSLALTWVLPVLDS
jgi:hypothetical protein